MPVRARRDPRGLFALAHIRRWRLLRFTVFRAKFFALSRVGILDMASLSELLSRPPSPTAHAAAQRRQGTTTAGHASKRQTRFTGASPSLRPLVAA